MLTVFKPLAVTLFLSLLTATAAQADLRVSFDEGAPKDRFRIENTGACMISQSSILLDLSTSSAGLIFDVTARGAGVDVFQPFEIVEGAGALAALPTVLDGQSQIRLDVTRLAPGETIAFTIDVDDTIGQREITVSNAEIEDATVSHLTGSGSTSATFTALARADVPASDCTTTG